MANPAPDSLTYLSVGFQMKDSKSGFVDESNAMIITQTKFEIETSVNTETFTFHDDGLAWCCELDIKN